MTDAETDVIDATRKWVEAKEEMLAVDESREGDPTETGHALDQAKYELTEAVYRLIGREPPLPLRTNRRIHRSERARASNFELRQYRTISFSVIPLTGGLKKATETIRIARMPGQEHSELRPGKQTSRSSASFIIKSKRDKSRRVIIGKFSHNSRLFFESLNILANARY